MKLLTYVLIAAGVFMAIWSMQTIDHLVKKWQPTPAYHDAQGNACYRVEGLGSMCGSTDPRWYGGGLNTLYYIDQHGTVVKGL
jgi:hypothetical protein